MVGDHGAEPVAAPPSARGPLGRDAVRDQKVPSRADRVQDGPASGGGGGSKGRIYPEDKGPSALTPNSLELNPTRVGSGTPLAHEGCGTHSLCLTLTLSLSRTLSLSLTHTHTQRESAIPDAVGDLGAEPVAGAGPLGRDAVGDEAM